MPKNQKKFPVQIQSPEVQKLLKESRKLLSRPHGNLDNSIKENIGEFGARRYIRQKYGEEILRETRVPRRGKGAPILDLVYELKSGKIIVIEAKYQKTKISPETGKALAPSVPLGKTNRVIFGVSEIGEIAPISQKNKLKQFSPQWFQNRLDELAKRKGEALRFANKLERAWVNGNIESLAIVVNEDGQVVKVKDFTQEWIEYKKSNESLLQQRKTSSVQRNSKNRATENKINQKETKTTPVSKNKPEIKSVDLSVESLPSKTNIRPNISKITFRFLSGLLIGVLQDIALGLFINYFEAQVNRETESRIKVAWKDKVYPKIEYQIQNQMKLSAEGKQSKTHKVYVGVIWTLITRQLREDISDVIVFFVKFAAQEPGFGEIYHDLEVQKEDSLLIYETKKKLTGESRKRRQDKKNKNLVRYPQLQWILVHDPQLIKISNELKKELRQNSTALEKVKQNYILVEEKALGGFSNSFGGNLNRIDEFLERFSYFNALKEIQTFENHINRTLFLYANQLIYSINLLRAGCKKALSNLVNLKYTLDSQERSLLSIYLGKNIEQLDFPFI